MIAPAKQALRLRLSVTGRCGMHCLYCRPPGACSDPPPEQPLAADEIRILVSALQKTVGIERVRLTGGEPLERGDIVELAAMLAELGVPDLALTTNGQRLAERAPDLHRAGLHRVNVSLDALRPDTFARMTGGRDLRATLNGIHAALDEGLDPVKLNMVVLRGINDGEIMDLLRFGLQNGCTVRFLEVMPIGIARKHFKAWFVSAEEIRRRLSPAGTWTRQAGDPGDSSRNWTVRDAEGRATTCGFIAPCSRPFCSCCRRLRVTSDGCLAGCLARNRPRPLRSALAAAACGDLRAFRALMHDALGDKRGPMFHETLPCMASVGG